MDTTLVDVNKYAAAIYLPSLRAEREFYASGKAFEFRPGTNKAMVTILDQQISYAERTLAAP